MGKKSINMEEKITNIFKNLREGKMSLEKAEQEIKDMFTDIKCKHCGKPKKTKFGLCPNCSKF